MDCMFFCLKIPLTIFLVNLYPLGVPRGILLWQPLCPCCFLPKQHLSSRVLLSKQNYFCIWIPLSTGDIQQCIWFVSHHRMQSLSWRLLLRWTWADHIYQTMWWRWVNSWQAQRGEVSWGEVMILITVFPVKPWTLEKISGMVIVLRPIKSEMKLQKITAKLRHALVTTWF